MERPAGTSTTAVSWLPSRRSVLFVCVAAVGVVVAFFPAGGGRFELAVLGAGAAISVGSWLAYRWCAPVLGRFTALVAVALAWSALGAVGAGSTGEPLGVGALAGLLVPVTAAALLVPAGKLRQGVVGLYRQRSRIRRHVFLQHLRASQWLVDVAGRPGIFDRPWSRDPLAVVAAAFVGVAVASYLVPGSPWRTDGGGALLITAVGWLPAVVRLAVRNGSDGRGGRRR